MRLLKRYGLQMFGAVLLLGAVLLSVFQSSQVIREDYYASWIADDAGLLTRETKADLEERNRRLDAQYGCVIGLVTAAELRGAPIADLAYETFDAVGCGGNDFLIVLAADERQGYLAYGDVMARYVDNSLRQTILTQLDSAFDSDPDAAVRRLCGDLETWMKTHVPAASGESYGRRQTTSGSAFLRVLLLNLLLAAALFAAARYLFLPLLARRRARDGNGEV